MPKSLRGAWERAQRNGLGDALDTLVALVGSEADRLRRQDRDALFDRATAAVGPEKLEALARWAMVSVPRRDAFVSAVQRANVT